MLTYRLQSLILLVRQAKNTPFAQLFVSVVLQTQNALLKNRQKVKVVFVQGNSSRRVGGF